VRWQLDGGVLGKIKAFGARNLRWQRCLWDHAYSVKTRDLIPIVGELLILRPFWYIATLQVSLMTHTDSFDCHMRSL
jgi:hypothetical protein